jgi:hypothetical protein
VKRFLLTLVVAVGLAAWVGAEGDGSRPSAVEQAQLLHRNRELLEALVDGGVGLAQESAYLERAGRCQFMAVKLKDEIRQAAGRDERARAAELAGHLGRLIEQGMVPNLREARKTIKPGSQEEPRLFDLRDQANALLRQVGEALAANFPGAEGERSRESLDVIRSQVDQAVQSK